MERKWTLKFWYGEGEGQGTRKDSPQGEGELQLLNNLGSEWEEPGRGGRQVEQVGAGGGA